MERDKRRSIQASTWGMKFCGDGHAAADMRKRCGVVPSDEQRRTESKASAKRDISRRNERNRGGNK